MAKKASPGRTWRESLVTARIFTKAISPLVITGILDSKFGSNLSLGLRIN
jgi:hypothetical protein